MKRFILILLVFSLNAQEGYSKSRRKKKVTYKMSDEQLRAFDEAEAESLIREKYDPLVKPNQRLVDAMTISDRPYTGDAEIAEINPEKADFIPALSKRDYVSKLYALLRDKEDVRPGKVSLERPGMSPSFRRKITELLGFESVDKLTGGRVSGNSLDVIYNAYINKVAEDKNFAAEFWNSLEKESMLPQVNSAQWVGQDSPRLRYQVKQCGDSKSTPICTGRITFVTRAGYGFETDIVCDVSACQGDSPKSKSNAADCLEQVMGGQFRSEKFDKSKINPDHIGELVDYQGAMLRKKFDRKVYPRLSTIKWHDQHLPSMFTDRGGEDGCKTNICGGRVFFTGTNGKNYTQEVTCDFDSCHDPKLCFKKGGFGSSNIGLQQEFPDVWDSHTRVKKSADQ